ncbi:MAG: N-acetylmuramoyl-L-alanine amidase [Bacteroidota bacterium]|nr:N-acetylmuramoyl-L-alanine amidase [Bacteroidota bacterium]
MNNWKTSLKRMFFLLFVGIHVVMYSQSKDKFKVVLDAGHGGKDPGAVAHQLKEKDVTLSVVLKVGQLLSKYKDVEVIYTRKTDKTLELDQRPKIANKSKANVFVSVHCNSVENRNNAAKGTETFVLGVSRDKHNMEVAKKENSVIFLEENYQEKYQGYDPNNPESVVGLMLLQDEYKNQSISLASAIQKDFANRLNRLDRGVKQAGFLVLRDCAMPSILIELGFLTNKEEANYLKSEKGQQELAKSIANAIINYKNDHYSYSEASEIISDNTNTEFESASKNTNSPKTKESALTKAVQFKVQISTSTNNLETKPQNFKGLKPITKNKEGKLFRYYYGDVSDYKKAQELLKIAKNKGYTDAYIVAFKNGKQVKISEVVK